MISFWQEYGLFLAKVATVVVALLVVMIIPAILATHRRGGKERDHLQVNSLNHRYRAMTETLEEAILPKRQLRKLRKERKAERKAQQKEGKEKARLFVVDFKGDLQANAVTPLRHEITAILNVAKPEDEVLVRLESPGGAVPPYGLAASQLKRIRDRKILLTVAVDKVAASGGYLMACVADKIIAAPFAVVGSIGVVAELPNFHRALRQRQIDVELFTAGEFKRTVTMFGENNDQGRAKFQEELDDVHALFKEFVNEHRPTVDIESVATGEHWYGRRALNVGLVDELMTSDDYLLKAAPERDIYQLHWEQQRRFLKRVREAASLWLERLELLATRWY